MEELHPSDGTTATIHSTDEEHDSFQIDVSIIT